MCFIAANYAAPSEIDIDDHDYLPCFDSGYASDCSRWYPSSNDKGNPTSQTTIQDQHSKAKANPTHGGTKTVRKGGLAAILTSLEHQVEKENSPQHTAEKKPASTKPKTTPSSSSSSSQPKWTRKTIRKSIYLPFLTRSIWFLGPEPTIPNTPCSYGIGESGDSKEGPEMYFVCHTSPRDSRTAKEAAEIRKCCALIAAETSRHREKCAAGCGCGVAELAGRRSWAGRYFDGGGRGVGCCASTTRTCEGGSPCCSALTRRVVRDAVAFHDLHCRCLCFGRATEELDLLAWEWDRRTVFE